MQNDEYKYKPGDRILSESQFLAIQKAIAQIADASKELSKGVNALEDAYRSCCIHAPAPAPARGPSPRKVPDKRAS
jgi:hypothetical protein